MKSHITTQYQLHTELLHLRMRAGDFSGYLRKFNTLRNQLNPALVEPALTFAFTRGLTPEFEQEVLYARAAELQTAIDRALLFDITRRTGVQSSSGRSSFAENARHVSFSTSRSRSRSSHSSASRHRPTSPFGRNPAHTFSTHHQSSDSSRPSLTHRTTSGSSRPSFTTRTQSSPMSGVQCYTCGQKGHYAASCRSGPSMVRTPAPQFSGPPSAPVSGRSSSTTRSSFSRGRGRGRPFSGKGGR